MKLLNKILSSFCSQPILTLLVQMDTYPEDFYLDSCHQAHRIIEDGQFNPIEHLLLHTQLRRIRRLETFKRIYGYTLTPHQKSFWPDNT